MFHEIVRSGASLPVLVLAAVVVAGGRDDGLPEPGDAAQVPALGPSVVIDGDFGKISDVEVDRRARIYVADQQAARVAVFDMSGARLAVVGGSGSGPGEFTYLNDLEIAGDVLSVFDHGSSRLTVFSLADSIPSLVRSVRVEVVGDEYSASGWHAALPDQFLVLFRTVQLVGDSVVNRPDQLRRVSIEGELLDADGIAVAGIQNLVLSSSVSSMPFGGAFDVLTGPSGRAVVMQTASDSILLVGPDNDVSAVQLAELEIRPVSEAEIATYVESIEASSPVVTEIRRQPVRDGAELGLLPPNHPRYLGLVVVENGYWLRLLTEDHEQVSGALGPEYRSSYELLVRYDTEGLPTDTVRVGFNGRLEAATDTQLILVSIDTLGVERVVVVPIE